ETGERHGDIETATLVEHSQGIGACESHRNALVNLEWQGGAHPWHEEAILARSCPTGEIGLINILIWSRYILVPHIGAERERTLEDGGAALGIDQKEFIGRNGHFTQAAEVIANLRDFR